MFSNGSEDGSVDAVGDVESCVVAVDASVGAAAGGRGAIGIGGRGPPAAAEAPGGAGGLGSIPPGGAGGRGSIGRLVVSDIFLAFAMMLERPAIRVRTLANPTKPSRGGTGECHTIRLLRSG